MSSRSTLAKRNENICKMLVEGVPVKEVASRYKMHPNSVRAVIATLIDKGLLARVPNTTPAIYYDPRSRVNITDAEESEIVPNDGYVPSNGVFMDSLPPSKRLPLGWVNRHISGYVGFKIRAVGTFDDVPDPRGVGTLGYWSEPESGGRGQTLRKWTVMLFNQCLRVAYFESTHGIKQFRVHVGRIYYNTEKATKKQADEMLVERAVYIAGLLKATGWQVTDPKIHGVIHTAVENHPLTKFIPKGENDHSKDVVVDSSPGFPEAEMEHDVDDETISDFSNLPSAVKGVRKGIAEANETIGKMGSEIKEVREDVEVAKESIRSGSARLDDCQATLAKVLAFLDKMAEVEVRRGEVMAMQEANHAKMMELMAARDSEDMSRLMSKDDRPFDGRGYL